MREPWFDLSTYFPLLDNFEQADLLKNAGKMWHILLDIGAYTRQLISQVQKSMPNEKISGLDVFKNSRHPEKLVVKVSKLVEVKKSTVLDRADIVLEKGVVLEPAAIIKAPAYIGADTQILHGAYLGRNVVIGRECTIGHCTEVKNSVIMNKSAAAHFAYIGDSVLGSYVNIGAGTRLANLQFRTGEDKVKGTFRPRKLVFNQQRIAVDQFKIGAFIGDYSETGCNAVLSPGVFLGANSWVYPNITVKKGYYPPETFISE